VRCNEKASKNEKRSYCALSNRNRTCEFAIRLHGVVTRNSIQIRVVKKTCLALAEFNLLYVLRASTSSSSSPADLASEERAAVEAPTGVADSETELAVSTVSSSFDLRLPLLLVGLSDIVRDALETSCGDR
jgi:hypothetical protein